MKKKGKWSGRKFEKTQCLKRATEIEMCYAFIPPLLNPASSLHPFIFVHKQEHTYIHTHTHTYGSHHSPLFSSFVLLLFSSLSFSPYAKTTTGEGRETKIEGDETGPLCSSCLEGIGSLFPFFSFRFFSPPPSPVCLVAESDLEGRAVGAFFPFCILFVLCPSLTVSSPSPRTDQAFQSTEMKTGSIPPPPACLAGCLFWADRQAGCSRNNTAGCIHAMPGEAIEA
mmetsp:Transcript_703/g.1592  ORF Transcript_703/g.1592 Transcript_703/m.1592 type:complete len:226 (-) Transcript_703:198-875(-)